MHGGEGGKDCVYLSKSHAVKFGGSTYAYNGIPIDEYIFSDKKEDFLLFLAKVKRSKKGIDSAIKVAKLTKNTLIVAGGKRLNNPETWFNWHPLIKPIGFVNGNEKFKLLSKAKALLVPIKWDEPFGLTIIEAMLSGTPVIAFNRGAMKELIVHGETGFLCENEEDMVKAIKKVDQISAHRCREHAVNHFSVHTMYLRHNQLLDKTYHKEE